MELPKNITQIGETDKSCKIYVEDYVVSYMKQMNRFAEDKEIAIALYGRRSEEQSLTYCFIYGACKLDFLQKPVRHLSQAQNQEIEKLRRKYFSNCEVIGYTILNGEMIEGIHIAEQNGCRYVKGYACFYEKNDPMLAYMLDSRVTEAAPEEVSLEKYEEVKRRQEERRQEYAEQEAAGRRESNCSRRSEEPREDKTSVQDKLDEESEKESPEESWVPKRDASQRASKRNVTELETHMRGMRFAAASMFVVLCLVSVVTLQTDGMGQEISDKVKNLFQGISIDSEQKEESMQVMSGDVIHTLVAEEQLAEAIRQENEQKSQNPLGPTTDPMLVSTTDMVPQPTPVATADMVLQPTLAPTVVSIPQPTPVATADTVLQPTLAPTVASIPQPTPVATTDTVLQPTLAPTVASIPQPTPVPTAAPTPQPTPVPEPTAVPVQSQKVFNTYQIRSGDTLIGISISLYGSETYVKEICALNGISNPDNIQIGQKILLP